MRPIERDVYCQCAHPSVEELLDSWEAQMLMTLFRRMTPKERVDLVTQWTNRPGLSVQADSDSVKWGLFIFPHSFSPDRVLDCSGFAARDSRGEAE